jgi:hypothetical protein
VALLEDAGVEFVSGEKFLVDQTLYHAVRWFGRYPVPHPRDGQRYADQVTAASGSIFNHPGAISTDHYRRACELFDRMREQLECKIARS